MYHRADEEDPQERLTEEELRIRLPFLYDVAGDLAVQLERSLTDPSIVLTPGQLGSFNQILHDVRTALEEDGIAWTMWDYRGGFGVVYKTDGQPAKVDPAVVEAAAVGAHRPAAVAEAVGRALQKVRSSPLGTLGAT